MNTRSCSIALLACCMLLFSCKKEEAQTPDPQPGPNVTTGTPTAVGTPVGPANSMTIDAGGGSITSADGRLSITVPVGALTTATEITIQPVTNQCFGGTGLAYELGPDGQHFEQPITLTFNYTAEDLIGTDAQALRIAFQDDAMTWNAFVNYSTDTIAGQVAILTDHFTTYAMFRDIFLEPGSAQVQVNEDIELRIKIVRVIEIDNDELIQLGNVFDMDVYPAVDWTVNGAFNQPFNGVLSNDGGNVNTYTAPAGTAGMSSNPVTIGARMTDGQQVLHLLSNIEVLDAANTVIVNMSVPEQPGQGCTFGAYTDQASFTINSDYTVNAAGIDNTAGLFNAFYGIGGCSCTMTEACDYFELSSVEVEYLGGVNYSVILFIEQEPAPGYTIDCPGTGPIDSPVITDGPTISVYFTVPFDGASHTVTSTGGFIAGSVYVATFTPE